MGVLARADDTRKESETCESQKHCSPDHLDEAFIGLARIANDNLS